MPQSASTEFVAKNGHFGRTRYAAALGLHRDDAEVSETLARHVAADEIREYAPDVFTSVVYHSDPAKPSPDPFLEAMRLRPDAVIAYHSVFVLRGCSYSATFCRVQAVSPSPPATIESGGFLYEFTPPPPGLPLGDGPDPDGVETVPCMGLEIRRTTLERAIVDLFADHSKVGEILFESLSLVRDIDPAAVARHARAVGDAGTAGALGFWLEGERDRHGVDDATLAELRALAPRRLQHAMGAGPGGRECDDREPMLGAGWNVLLPAEMVKPLFEGVDLDEYAADEYAAWSGEHA